MKNSIDFIHPLLSIYQSLQLPFRLSGPPIFKYLLVSSSEKNPVKIQGIKRETYFAVRGCKSGGGQTFLLNSK